MLFLKQILKQIECLYFKVFGYFKMFLQHLQKEDLLADMTFLSFLGVFALIQSKKHLVDSLPFFSQVKSQFFIIFDFNRTSIDIEMLCNSITKTFLLLKVLRPTILSSYFCRSKNNILLYSLDQSFAKLIFIMALRKKNAWYFCKQTISIKI